MANCHVFSHGELRFVAFSHMAMCHFLSPNESSRFLTWRIVTFSHMAKCHVFSHGELSHFLTWRIGTFSNMPNRHVFSPGELSRFLTWWIISALWWRVSWMQQLRSSLSRIMVMIIRVLFYSAYPTGLSGLQWKATPNVGNICVCVNLTDACCLHKSPEITC